MAYFAELDADNNVLRVVSIFNSVLQDEMGAEQESLGVAYCLQLFGESTNWLQTSYNTRGGVHVNGGTPLRKNYAGPGFTYDQQRDAFIGPQPASEGWVLNEQTCCWENPALMDAAQAVQTGVTRV